ncbi:DNA adenine methylase [Clostridium sp. 19966]|uniref:DNA adenine methylase n=1 Tax=Clostridium sp. 19966 TaxID=2768166 RepID=UPI0028DEEDB9|nr:DNA adenine methylase [Clostridium sp. 19966]MDT8718206.1 DNA adenine methylase [Clostridium sp. 19966]
MLKPPIARMGGKSKLRKKIIEKLPEHLCYVEPFFGVGWVYFGKIPSQVEVINDVNGELINLFKMIKYHAPEIQRLMEYEISARDLFSDYKSQNIEKLTELQRAIRFIYTVSQSFASKGISYGYGTTTKPSPQIFNTGNLTDLKERLRNTYIENLSFEKIIEKYDREHTVFFCDPPYYETDGYGNEFKEKEHLILLDTLKSIKGKFLLTLNDHPKVREWYKDYNMQEVQVMYSVAKKSEARKNYNELIITNY